LGGPRIIKKKSAVIVHKKSAGWKPDGRILFAHRDGVRGRRGDRGVVVVDDTEFDCRFDVVINGGGRDVDRVVGDIPRVRRSAAVIADDGLRGRGRVVEGGAIQSIDDVDG